MEKFIFVRFLESQDCLPDNKKALKKALTDMNLALKMSFRTRIWSSNILTGHDFFFYWCQNISYIQTSLQANYNGQADRRTDRKSDL